MTFAACLPIILQSEGGFSDNPKDPGGATNLGVTQATLSAWIGHPAEIADVKALTPADVAPIYEQNYYNASHANECPAGVDMMVFDDAVNTGPGRATKRLQAALGVSADGVFGQASLAALRATQSAPLIDKLSELRKAYYESLSTFSTFGRGWLARVDRTASLAHAMVSP